MEAPKTDLTLTNDEAAGFTIDEIEVLTIEMALAVVALIDNKDAKKAETRKKIVDATMKSLGKMAGEGLKGWAKTNTFHPEIITPLTWASDVVVEEMGKAFAESILTLADSTKNKLNELLNRPLKAGFRFAISALTAHPKIQQGRDVQKFEFEQAIIQLTLADSTSRSQGEKVAVNWMLTLLYMRLEGDDQAKFAIKYCLPIMQTMRDEAYKLMTDNKSAADTAQTRMDVYKDRLDQITTDWPTKVAGEFSETAEQYNDRSQGCEGPIAVEGPPINQLSIDEPRKIEKRQKSLIRAIDYFIQLAA